MFHSSKWTWFLSKDLDCSVIFNGSKFSVIKLDRHTSDGLDKLSSLNDGNNDSMISLNDFYASPLYVACSHDACHKRCGHSSSHILSKSVIANNTVCNKNIHKCIICPLNKLKKSLFNNLTAYSIRPLEIIHVDVWNLALIPFVYGHEYYLLIIYGFLGFSNYEWKNIRFSNQIYSNR